MREQGLVRIFGASCPELVHGVAIPGSGLLVFIATRLMAMRLLLLIAGLASRRERRLIPIAGTAATGVGRSRIPIFVHGP